MCVIIYDEQSMTKLPLIREEDPSTFTSGIHSTSGETDDFLETGRRRRPPLLSSSPPTSTFFRISRSGRRGKSLTLLEPVCPRCPLATRARARTQTRVMNGGTRCVGHWGVDLAGPKEHERNLASASGG